MWGQKPPSGVKGKSRRRPRGCTRNIPMVDDIPKRKRKRGPPGTTSNMPQILRGPGLQAKMARTAAKRKEALELRINGATYEQIGARMTCSSMSAHRYVNEALKDIPADRAKQLREIEEGRLDLLTVRLNNERREKGADRVRIDLALLKVSESRRKLLGLDAPTRNEHTGKDGGAIITTAVDFEAIKGMSIDELERLQRDPAAIVNGGMLGRRGYAGAPEETRGEDRGPRRSH